MALGLIFPKGGTRPEKAMPGMPGGTAAENCGETA